MKAKVKEKDLELQKLGEPAPPVEETEDDISREDIFAYIDSLTAQEQEYNITVRSPIELKMSVIRCMLDVLYANVVMSTDYIPNISEEVRKEANDLMLKLIKAIKIEDEEEE